MDLPNLPDLWTILGIVLALAGIGAAMVAVPGIGRTEFLVARTCFIGAFLLFEAKLAVWGMANLSGLRLLTVGVAGAILSVSLAACLAWVNGKQALIATALIPIATSALAEQRDSAATASVVSVNPLDNTVVFQCSWSMPPATYRADKTLYIIEFQGLPVKGLEYHGQVAGPMSFPRSSDPFRSNKKIVGIVAMSQTTGLSRFVICGRSSRPNFAKISKQMMATKQVRFLQTGAMR